VKFLSVFLLVWVIFVSGAASPIVFRIGGWPVWVPFIILCGLSGYACGRLIGKSGVN
jgi:hypothetical protein